jgi:hypothetical protein
MFYLIEDHEYCSDVDEIYWHHKTVLFENANKKVVEFELGKCHDHSYEVSGYHMDYLKHFIVDEETLETLELRGL